MRERVNRGAFTLLETVVYLALLSGFLYGFVAFVCSLKASFARQSQGQEKQLLVANVLEVLKRDLMGASCCSQDWVSDKKTFVKKTLSKNSTRLSQGLSWELAQDGLYRKTGTYDFSSKKWITCRTTLLKCPIKKLDFKLTVEQGNVKAVDVLYHVNNQKPQAMRVVLRNGRVL